MKKEIRRRKFIRFMLFQQDKSFDHRFRVMSKKDWLYYSRYSHLKKEKENGN